MKAGRVQVADGKAEYPVWNHWEYRVVYKSLASQLCIGGVYVKLLMDGLDKVSYRGKTGKEWKGGGKGDEAYGSGGAGGRMRCVRVCDFHYLF